MAFKNRSATYGLTGVLSLVGAVLIPTLSPAQVGFREHNAGFGIVISLPASWHADSAAQLSALRERTLEHMRGSGIEQLREFAAQNENALLFRARDEKERTNSVNMNVTVGPDLTRSAFASANAAEIERLVSTVCSGFVAQAREVGGTARCLRHEVITIQNRKALMIVQEALIPRAGMDNRRTVVMLPSEGLLFTLSISLARSAADPGVSRAIIASIKLPAGV